MLRSEVQIDVEIEHQQQMIVLHDGCIGSRSKGREVSYDCRLTVGIDR